MFQILQSPNYIQASCKIYQLLALPFVEIYVAEENSRKNALEISRTILQTADLRFK